MILKKVINNNVVVGFDLKEGEMILLGRGLGFQAKPGQILDKNKIEKTYVLKKNSRIKDLLDQIPKEYMQIVDALVQKAMSEYEMHLNVSIYLGLSDHLYGAVQRKKENIPLENPFVSELECMYPKEWDLACFTLSKVKDLLEIELPQDEAGYICMHIIENSTKSSQREISENLKIINEIMHIIQEEYGLTKENTQPFAWNRLLNHVKFFVSRFLSNEETRSAAFDTKKEQIPLFFVKEASCAKKISEHLFQKYGRTMTQSEENYLILHLCNCSETTLG
jgi:beta-glucoside operon transcriptional antiterminator